MNDFCRVAQLTFVLSLVVACAGPVQARAEIGPLNHYQLPLRPSAQSVGAQVATSSALAAVLAIDPHE
ncbi:MAG TPA: hypothetical protein VMF89_17645, partial [Polyangiales bacterium]|nr:hypothetical protein [Polyangiales bacterium]